MRTLCTTEVNQVSGGNADAVLASLLLGGIVTAGIIASANQPYYYYSTPYYGYGYDYYVYDPMLYYYNTSPTVVVYDDYYYDDVVYVY